VEIQHTLVMDVDFNELLVNLFNDFNENLMNICSEFE
jgi:hypothetical protein